MLQSHILLPREPDTKQQVFLPHRPFNPIKKSPGSGWLSLIPGKSHLVSARMPFLPHGRAGVSSETPNQSYPNKKLLIEAVLLLSCKGRNAVKLEREGYFVSSYILLQQLLWFYTFWSCFATSALKTVIKHQRNQLNKRQLSTCAVCSFQFLCQDRPQVAVFRVYQIFRPPCTLTHKARSCTFPSFERD